MIDVKPKLFTTENTEGTEIIMEYDPFSGKIIVCAMNSKELKIVDWLTAPDLWILASSSHPLGNYHFTGFESSYIA